MQEKMRNNLKEKFLLVINLIISTTFVGFAVFLFSFTWKISLIWLGLAILFSPKMKTFLIQRLQFNPQKILLPKLFILLIGVISTPVIANYEKMIQQEAKEAQIRAKIEFKKQRFLKNRPMYVARFEELLAQERFTEVISKGEPYIEYDQEIQEIVEDAKKLQHRKQLEVRIDKISKQIKQLITLQKYEEAHKIAENFQGNIEDRELVKEVLKTHIDNEEDRLLSQAEATSESNVRLQAKIYRKLVKLVPETHEYKRELALYEYKERKEQQKEKVRQAQQDRHESEKTQAISKSLDTEQEPIRNGLQEILRSYPRTVPSREAAKIFGLSDSLTEPLRYIKNNFKDDGEVVIDYATGLMWKKGREKNANLDWLLYREAQAHIKQLNSKYFAGYNDWRLPTVDELLSIMEIASSEEGGFTNPILRTYSFCWSSDMEHKGGKYDSTVWVVNFHRHVVEYVNILEGRGQHRNYPCAVRTWKR